MVSKGETILEELRHNDTMDDLPIYNRAAVAVTSILPSIREGVVAGKVTPQLLEKFSDASDQASGALSELQKGATFYKRVRWGTQVGLVVGVIIAILILVLIFKPEIKLGKATVEVVVGMAVPTIIGLASPYADGWVKEKIDRLEHNRKTCLAMVKILTYIDQLIRDDAIV